MHVPIPIRLFGNNDGVFSLEGQVAGIEPEAFGLVRTGLERRLLMTLSP